jgi:hypothetical protein
MKNDCLAMLVGGQAPTWEVAQVRAETIGRIVANIRVDS